MNQDRTTRNRLALGLAVALCLTLLPLSPLATRAQQAANVQPSLSARERRAVVRFEQRVREYSKLREEIEDKLPKLPKEATPEQIEAHKQSFQRAVRTARAGARPGNAFDREAAKFIRATIKGEFKGRERRELREEVLGAETKAVPLRVNYPYPESEEFVEMAPTLLLKLPQLPKQVKYRFVGRNLLLVDRENGLIIDYMLNALP